MKASWLVAALLLAVGCSEPQLCEDFRESVDAAYDAGLRRGWDLAPVAGEVAWIRWPALISVTDQEPDGSKLVCIDYRVGDLAGTPGRIEIDDDGHWSFVQLNMVAREESAYAVSITSSARLEIRDFD